MCCRRFWQRKKESANVTVQAASQPNSVLRLASPFGQAQPQNQTPRSAFAQAQVPRSPAQVDTQVQQMSRSEDLKCRSLVTVLVVAFYYYPNLVTDALSFFACYNVDPGSRSADGAYAAKAKVGCTSSAHIVKCDACVRFDLVEILVTG